MFRRLLIWLGIWPKFAKGDIVLPLLHLNTESKYEITQVVFQTKEYVIRNCDYNVSYFMTWKTAEKEFAKCGTWNSGLAKKMKRW